MIQFRASLAGGCIREIVSSILTPEVLEPPISKKAFLRSGHALQKVVIDFLVEQGVNIPSASFLPDEFVGTYGERRGWVAEGHVDGVIRYPSETRWPLLEVKCITSKSFSNLLKSEVWWDLYPQYMDQIQVYMGFDFLTCREEMFVGPFPSTKMVFMNRDTGEILQGIGGISGTTYRKDMDVPRAPLLVEGIYDKLDEAYRFVKDGVVPDHCTAQGYCFFCKKYNNKNPKRTSKGRQVLIDKDNYITLWYEKWGEAKSNLKENRRKILAKLDKYNADVLTVQDTVIKRSDIVKEI